MLQYKKYIVLWLMYFFCFTVSAHAQKKVQHQNLIWLVYNNQMQFSSKWFLITEIQERNFIQPYAQHQFVIKTHLHRVFLKNFDLGIGFCYFLQDYNDPESTDKLTIPELRPQFEINNKQAFKYFNIDQRARLEFRFYHNLNSTGHLLEPGYSFGNYRFRYQFMLTIPLYKFKANQSLKLKLGDELFLNAGKKITKNIFDQNRISAAINIDLLPTLSFEIGYINWYQQRNSGVDFFNRNIIRFGINQKIIFNKKRNGTNKT